MKLPSRGNQKLALSSADNYTELFEDRRVLEAHNQKYKQLADCRRGRNHSKLVMVYLRKERPPLGVKGRHRHEIMGPFLFRGR